VSEIRFFHDSPDAGDPACLCSWCGKAIAEAEAPVMRVFNSADNTEARFHRACFGSATGTTIQTHPDDEFDGPYFDSFDDDREVDPFDEWLDRCGWVRGQGCTLAGSEECDFECPFRRDFERGLALGQPRLGQRQAAKKVKTNE